MNNYTHDNALNFNYTKEGPVYVPATLELDVGDLSSIEGKGKTAIAIYEHVDILVNNAGISFRGTVMETEIEVQQQIMNVNYFGALALTKGMVLNIGTKPG
jgi:dehydrogenase/reductase SDR family protein 7B